MRRYLVIGAIGCWLKTDLSLIHEALTVVPPSELNGKNKSRIEDRNQRKPFNYEALGWGGAVGCLI
jgi:hypothetical protein